MPRRYRGRDRQPPGAEAPDDADDEGPQTTPTTTESARSPTWTPSYAGRPGTASAV